MSNKTFLYVKNYQVIFFLIATVLLGVYLRLIGLFDQSYWLDELYSADFSNPSRSFSSMLLLTLNDVHPPLISSITVDIV